MNPDIVKLKPLHLPFETHTLPNGMRVVVQEDRGSPIVAVHLMYHVGSKDERPGRTGLAHLLEHLLFEGSENCAKGEFDRLLERVGGTNNGSTWLDRTNYYEVVPSHAVELALWLERERMAHFLPVLDEEMLAVQRSVVVNERKQAYENRPYGLAYERLHELLFPEGHPYSWPTIGYAADLEATRLEDARDFYERFYTPDNAVLVLAGDLSPEEGFELAAAYFGDLAPSGASNGITRVLPASRPEGRLEVMEDRVSFPQLHHAWSVPPFGTPDWVALDVLAYLLADGESSRLQRVLTRDQPLVQDIDAYLYPTELVGIWGIVATARSGVEVEQMTAAIDQVLERVADEGVPEDELEGAIRRARRDQLRSIDSVEDRAEELAYATTVLGDPHRLPALLNSYGEVTPDDIRNAAASLRPEQRASVVVVPGKGRAA